MYKVLPPLFTLLISGCSVADPQISFRPPEYVEEMPAREVEENFGNTGSLFGQGDNPLFSDRRAMKLNDLVTIVINESASSSSTGDRKLNETSSGAINGPSLTFGGPSESIGGAVNKLNNFTSFGISRGESKSSFQGSGSQTRKESFSTTISARIIKVMDNGNYFIEGGREILLNGEKQIMRLTGVIRPYDIGRNNTINSQYIADAKIMYETQGEIRRSTEKGWATRALEALIPF
ncbi:MAG: flagellar basal body L-ring protein FlgH [Wolinella sp.]